MVTAETAVVLPALFVVLAGAVAVLAVLGAQLRCVEAAGTAARLSARGESTSGVAATVAAELGGATTVTSVTASLVTVTISAPVPHLPGWMSGLRVRASASVPAEPRAGPLATVP